MDPCVYHIKNNLRYLHYDKNVMQLVLSILFLDKDLKVVSELSSISRCFEYDFCLTIKCNLAKRSRLVVCITWMTRHTLFPNILLLFTVYLMISQILWITQITHIYNLREFSFALPEKHFTLWMDGATAISITSRNKKMLFTTTGY